MNAFALALRQVRYENTAFWRNPAAAFFTIVLPLMFLVIFNLVFGDVGTDEHDEHAGGVPPGTGGRRRHVLRAWTRNHGDYPQRGLISGHRQRFDTAPLVYIGRFYSDGRGPAVAHGLRRHFPRAPLRPRAARIVPGRDRRRLRVGAPAGDGRVAGGRAGCWRPLLPVGAPPLAHALPYRSFTFGTISDAKNSGTASSWKSKCWNCTSLMPRTASLPSWSTTSST